jgi:hypothetical protein
VAPGTSDRHRGDPSGRDPHRIPDLALASPEVTGRYRIAGEDCYFMQIHLRNMENLDKRLHRFTPCGQTTISIIHCAPCPLGDYRRWRGPRKIPPEQKCPISDTSRSPTPKAVSAFPIHISVIVFLDFDPMRR